MHMKQLFKIDKLWIVAQKGNTLIISGGADKTYELALSQPTTAFTTINNQEYDPQSLSSEDQIIHEQLVVGGISTPVLSMNKPIKVKIISKTSIQITTKQFTLSDTNYDFVVLVRTGQTLAKSLQDWDYASLDTPHIFIDAAYYDTISIGPLVFPGETACLACLQGRIEYRWGDDEPPLIPRASTQEKIIDGIIEQEIQRFIEKDFTKIGKTIAFNLRTYTALEHALYKIEYCPICRKVPIDRIKKLH
jgi:hypothetical protein